MAFLPVPLIFFRSISSSRAIFLTAGPALIPLKSMDSVSIAGCLSSLSRASFSDEDIAVSSKVLFLLFLQLQ